MFIALVCFVSNLCRYSDYSFGNASRPSWLAALIQICRVFPWYIVLFLLPFWSRINLLYLLEI